MHSDLLKQAYSAMRHDLRRTLLRLADLLTAHLADEEGCLAVLATRLTPGQSGALARALDHVVERV